ncbi:shikimate-5-dehydrogenase, fungal AROM-type [Mycobacteroides abscessus subsp. abscessus]|nr:shikimate-5-dehydrogenase, fungal AROM-type [Mycobacteroides abscessus subsp. abscessus]
MGEKQVGETGRRFAVIGDPIAHSLSPELHAAAYRALGIEGASYERIHVPRGEFAKFVQETLPALDGVSVTMPHKAHAHDLAVAHGPHAELGIANTLIPLGSGHSHRYAAFNTDIAGITGALAAAGIGALESATLLGSGATALSLATALCESGCTRFTLLARSREKLAALEGLLARYGAQVHIGEWERPELSFHSDIVASALALDGAEAFAERVFHKMHDVARVPSAFFDALYFPDPTPLTRIRDALCRERAVHEEPAFATGAHMLAHQAARQVELMCGVEHAPAEVMCEAVFGQEL